MATIRNYYAIACDALAVHNWRLWMFIGGELVVLLYFVNKIRKIQEIAPLAFSML